MKKLLSLVLCLVLCLSNVALAESFPIPEDPTPYFDWADTLDVSGKTYDEHVTIQLTTQNLNDTVDYLAGDTLTLWFQDHFNFTWELEALPSSGASDKIRTLINGDEVPDVLWWFSWYQNEVYNYIQEGYFKALPEDWETRWPNLARAQASVPASVYFRSLTEGKQYVLFRPVFLNYQPVEVQVNQNCVYIRKDWAEAVGFPIKDVYTADEIVEFGRLLKEKDPGNVGDKLIPITGPQGYLMDLFIDSSFPEFSGIEKINGTYEWTFANEKTLEGLKLFKTAYKEGLLSPEFYVYTDDEAYALFYNTLVSGVCVKHSNPGHIADVQDGLKENGLEFADVVHQAAYVGRDGYYHGWENGNYWGVQMFSADCPDEVMYRYLDIADFVATKEAQKLIYNGFKGIDWELDANGVEVTNCTEEIGGYSSGWPIYHLTATCGDDFAAAIEDNHAAAEKERMGWWFAVMQKKNDLITDGSIIPIDHQKAAFTSETQDMYTNVDCDTLAVNLVVSDGDLETEWKAAIDENMYLVQPAVDELNELFGDK